MSLDLSYCDSNKFSNSNSNNRDDISRTIDCSKEPFWGREEEIQGLHNVYKKLRNQDKDNDDSQKEGVIPVTFISGCSGTGKSTLVQHFVNEINSNKNTHIQNSNSGENKSKNVLLIDENESNNNNSNKKRCLILCGKANKLYCKNPFAVIVDVLNAFSSNFLLEDQQENYEGPRKLQKNDRSISNETVLRNDIQKSLGEYAINVLTRAAPDLVNVIGSRNSCAEGRLTTAASDNNNFWCHLKHVFVAFINAISTKDHPVVMVIDDMQWIDTASLDLVLSILTDTSLRHFMFIGVYQYDVNAASTSEVGIRHIKAENEHNFDQVKSKILLSFFEKIVEVRPIKRITLLNLSIDETTEYIRNFILLEPESANDYYEEGKITPLAKEVYNKTRGNIFFVVQLLQYFKRNSLLCQKSTANITTTSLKWEWLRDLDTQKQQQMGDGALVDILLVHKMKSTPKMVQRALIIASHVRSNYIDHEILHKLMQRMGFHIREDELLNKILPLAAAEGFLTVATKDSDNYFLIEQLDVSPKIYYRFAHDRIWHAVYATLADNGKEKRKLQRTIGKLLLNSWLSDKKKDWMLYAATAHLNIVNDTNSEDPFGMTILNLEVGIKMLKIADFDLASEYLQNALSSAQRIKKRWENYFDIIFRLYLSLAEVELMLGHYDVGYTLAREVLDHMKNIKDALPMYKSLGNAFTRQAMYIEALDFYYSALKEIGEDKKNYKIVRLVTTFVSVKQYFKRHSDKDILNLPMMEDIDMLAVMELYNNAADQAFLLGRLVDWLFITVRRLQITFKHGLCEFSAFAFMGFAGVVAKKDFQAGLRIAKLGRRIFLERTKSKRFECKLSFMWVMLFAGWNSPYEESIKILKHGEKVGTDMGDIEWANSTKHVIINILFMAGHPLDDVCIECRKYLAQNELHNSTLQISEYTEFALKFHFLSNAAPSPAEWEQLHDFDSSSPDVGSNQILGSAYQSRLVLAVYFGEYEFAVKYVELLEKITINDLSFEVVPLKLFYSGLVFSGLLHIAIQRKQRRRAKKFASLARQEAKKMNALYESKNMVGGNHRYLIMQAVLMATENQKPFCKIREAFETAILHAIKSNHKHHAALCNELAGEYYLTTKNSNEDRNKNRIDKNKNLARDHFTQAIFFYKEWGAMGKVNHLLEKRGSCIPYDYINAPGPRANDFMLFSASSSLFNVT